MALRYIPLHLKHSATPKITDFAVLAGLEAAVRGTLISTVPIAVYDAFGSASNLSTVYLAAGIITLFWGLLVPRITQMLPRRWVYSTGCALYLVAMALFIMGTPMSVQAAILISGMATVTTFVCLNAYVLDYVARADLGKTQGQQIPQIITKADPWHIAIGENPKDADLIGRPNRNAKSKAPDQTVQRLLFEQKDINFE